MTTRTRVPKLLTPGEVCDLLDIEPRRLRLWREQNTGPVFVRLSHRTIRYPLPDLIDFLNDARRGY
ncbi:helix-turn-helix transcriptional regulator [Microbacterium sp. NPDC058389]|uniref:helix-turn-helix transcriptional regulator n=1 Tax=Microbacterium sp. NPDC058389 TaxID=3346475 RepID=UPI00365E677F